MVLLETQGQTQAEVIFPSLRKNENPIWDWDCWMQQGTNFALQEISRNYEDEIYLPFHCRPHTRDGVLVVHSLLDDFHMAAPELVTPKDVCIGVLSYAFHDIVMTTSVISAEKNGIVYPRIKRHFPSNEIKSAQRLAGYMQSINERIGETIFNGTDIQTGKDAIIATVPYFDLYKKTVTHPYLTAESPIVAKVVAWVDVGMAGCSGFDTFKYQTDAHYLEDYVKFFEALRTGNWNGIDKEFYWDRMIEWMESQLNFCMVRGQITIEQIETLPKELQPIVLNRFSKFNQTEAQFSLLMQARKSMNFDCWLQDAHYIDWQSYYFYKP